jgi:MHS family alpha-ketoglutarate permease-like MFS transporter
VSSAVTEQRQKAQGQAGRQIAAASVGNAVEWYDWYIYTFLTPVFAAQIFAAGDQLVDVLSAFAVFAVGFFLRPIGGLLIGSLADRWGRKNTLTLTILLMGFGSLVLAVTPTYAQVGAWSPVIFVFGRLICGLSIGGEFAANTTFLVESAPPGRRGFFSSFQYVSTTVGQLIASGLATLLALALSEAQLSSVGWRIGFAVGAVIALVGLIIRRQAVETRVVRSGSEPRPGVFEALRRYPRASLLVCGVTVGGTIAYYTWTTYLPTYAQQNGTSLDRALLVSTVSLAFFAVIQPVVGALSDRVGRRPLLIGFGVLFAVGIVPALALVRAADSAAGLLIITLLGMVALAGFTSISAAVNAELVPGRVRAAGIGFPYSLTVAAFGGTAPFVGTLFAKLGHPGLFGWWVAVLVAVTLVVAIFLPETAHRELD